MNAIIKNEFLTAEISPLGAELQSLTDKDGINYLWQGDQMHWGRRSPILFPMIGKHKNNRYTFEGKDYTMMHHGFVKNMSFSLGNKGEAFASFFVASDRLTKAVYPFDFLLQVNYVLTGPCLSIQFHVTNQDNKTMYFCLGAYPAFICTWAQDNFFEAHSLVFETFEEAKRYFLNEDLLLLRNTSSYKGEAMTLNQGTFQDNSILLSGLQSRYIYIQSTQQSKKIRVGIQGFPFVSIGSPCGKEAPFVCISPCYGHTDYEDSESDLTKKEDTVALDAGQTFSCEYSISIL